MPSGPARAGDFRSFVEVVQARAAGQPDLPVYTFLRRGDEIDATITCRDLDLAARRVAVALLARVRPGDRVMLLYPPGIDYIVGFMGCLYAGVVCVPAYPIEPAQLNRTLPRFLSIVEDCRPTAILTTSATRLHADQALADVPELRALTWIASDDLATSEEGGGSDMADGWTMPRLPDDQPAYLQYTSGSTGTPKGVMISHRNMLHNSMLIERGFGHDSSSRGMIWLPPYHDMGLIGGIIQPLYAGFPVALMSHLDFLKHPFKWLRQISRFRATTSGGPNFAYEMLATMRINDSDLAALDLSCWDVAFTGAEFIRESTLRRFAERFAPCGFRFEAFYPCYGLAEHTLIASGGDKRAAPLIVPVDADADVSADGPVDGKGGRRNLVGCGQAFEGSRVAIVDVEGSDAGAVERGDGQEGEIWLRGPSVALGYWERPDLNAELFEARLAGRPAETYMRTGDLGFKRGAELFVTGRIKDLIIVRGSNHYPQDIETTVEALHPDLFRPSSCAVFAIESDEEPRVVVVREMRARYAKAQGDDAPRREDLFAALRRAVSQTHGLALSAIVFVQQGTIPKTTSGKIQRFACRAAYLDGTLPVIAEWRAAAPMPVDA